MTPRGPVSPASESVSSRGTCSGCSPATSYPVPASVDTSAPTCPLTSPTHGTPVSMSLPSKDSHPILPVVSAATIALNVEGGQEEKSTCLLTMFFFLHGPGLLLGGASATSWQAVLSQAATQGLQSVWGKLAPLRSRSCHSPLSLVPFSQRVTMAQWDLGGRACRAGARWTQLWATCCDRPPCRGLWAPRGSPDC